MAHTNAPAGVKRNIVIAGGGTGGHIYPAIAIARALQRKDPNVQVHFVGTPAGLENQLVPKQGFPLHLIKVGKLNMRGQLLSKVRTILGLPSAFVQAAALLMELKPEVVLGVGGYVSGPFVLMSSILGFQTAIWEPNAKPGLTNRWLSRFVKKSFVVFDEANSFLKSKIKVPVGLPVREEIEGLPERTDATHRDFRILVFGGSQGARAINQAVRNAVLTNSNWMDGISIVHQTGVYDFTATDEAYQNRANVSAHSYLHDMDQKYQWADMVICRSGASTVAELAAARKPAILIPLPTAADDHQKKNALAMVKAQAAVMIEQSELTPERLIAEITALKNNSARREEMKKNLAAFHKPKAADRVAELLIAEGEP